MVVAEIILPVELQLMLLLPPPLLLLLPQLTY
ncbi:hypothetical protein Gohar_023188, partial [Gossypium harknessii]|nr:hypothetical protein [Gossypium harknessii]